ncbi:MAG: SNF2-related protein, partial [Spartobacteria bacterium]
MISPDFFITEEQLRKTNDALRYFGSSDISKGTSLLRDGAVGELMWDDAGEKIFTKVMGTSIYTVEVFFQKQHLLVTCNCPVRGNCKHLAATLLKMRQMTPGQAAPAMETGPDSIHAAISHKLPAKLSRKAQRFLKEAEAWWKKKSSRLNLSDLKNASGDPAFWRMGDIEIFPVDNPPANASEYFACVLAACNAQQIDVPHPMYDVADMDGWARLQRVWKRADEIKKWRTTFDKWDESDERISLPDVDFRLMLLDDSAVIQGREYGNTEFGKTTMKFVNQFVEKSYQARHSSLLGLGSNLVLQAAKDEYGGITNLEIRAMRPSLSRSLTQLATSRDFFDKHVVGVDGQPLRFFDQPLRWEIKLPKDPSGDYQLMLLDEAGRMPPPPLAILSGKPLHYVTGQAAYPIAVWPFGEERPQWPLTIPSQAIESREGMGALGALRIPVPSHMAAKVQRIAATVNIQCRIFRYRGSATDYFQMNAETDFQGYEAPQIWGGANWWNNRSREFKPKPAGDALIQFDRSAIGAATEWIRSIPLKQAMQTGLQFWHEQRIVGKDWPDQFLSWVARRPEGCILELDPELAGLREGMVAGHVQIDIEDSKDEIDWFDLSVALHVNDSTLTQKEIDLLLKAKGKWVRLEGKGWRKLEYQLTEDQLKELADLGLSVNDFSNEKQRLHALQLAGLTKKTTSLLGSERVAQVRRRVEEIQTRVTPPAPDAITATLRPYQLEGFHFLAYLTANNFGGVLADDMGLGKTLQALSWIAWLRKEGKITEPVLVVCPKSVQDNWANECRKFFPELKVEVWSRASAGKTGLDKSADLLVIHYPQLRSHEDALRAVSWGAVILDEAQAIKNPTSQSAKAACALPSKYRLALSGTPIENRLLDLWSIFAFAMPGALGNRTAFTKQFDKKDDPFARRRLAARTRPFLLRRTKNEVARDLPDRVEEDLVVEFEGIQSDLYKAEIKRARAQLLKIETSKQLDKMRFNILTSLLRLRQICCHPRLLGLEDAKKKKSTDEDSAKLSALLELLEPLMEEGQKVLVFSQFVEMLEIIESEIKARDWKTFKLTGETDDRGPLVDSFQKHEGSAVFLISLKAGGSGLNLTAASYVVLFDPWWNPAVEAQAIDRTHRIGQKQTVFAYRLIIKGT